MTDIAQAEENLLLKALRDSARLCVAVSRDTGIAGLEKDGAGPVTVGDWGSQALVCAALQEALPTDPIVGEEDASKLRDPQNEDLVRKTMSHIRAVRADASEEQVLQWIDRGVHEGRVDRFWTVDPIDGTKGFLRGDQYATALALVLEGEVVLGGLACPNLEIPTPGGAIHGVALVARRGHGTWAYPLEGGGGVRVRVSPETDTARARFCESWEKAHSAHDSAAQVAAYLGITRESRRMDSQAKYGVVASGDAEIYLRLPTRVGYVEKIWDHAAGAIVVEEAGGKVSDIYGAPLDFMQGRRLEKNRGVIVTNGVIHDKVLAAVASLG